jgi:quercetin dioxygenase-like cupin family protein
MTSAASEMDRTLHLASEDVPWVSLSDGSELRILHARPEEDFVATQFRAHPWAEHGLHRHLAPVFGFTSIGAWGHNRKYEYGPGSYIFETPGVPHKFLNGPGISEVFFINHGSIEFFDPDTMEISGSMTLAQMVETYMNGCEQAGLPRPNILT